MALNRLWKEYLFIVWELKWEGRASPCSTPAGGVQVGQFKFFATLHMSTTDHKSSASIYFVLKINFSQ